MARWFPCFALVALISSTVAVSAETAAPEEVVEEESHVLVLDSSNFTQIVEQHPFILVEFYAPWCGHCKRLAPEYERAATTLKDHEPPIVLAKVDANEETNKGLASQYGIQGYPTLKIIENKGTRVRDYKGPREADGIVSYLKKQSGPPSEEISSADLGAKVVEENDIVIVGLFSSLDSEEFKNFTEAADELRSDYDFRHTTDASVLPTKDTALTSPAIRLFKKFDEGFNDLKEFSVEAIKKFVEDASMPLIVTMSRDPAHRPYLTKFFSLPESKVFLFANLTAENGEEYKAVYTQLAQNYKGILRFLIADAEDSQNALNYFGLKANKLPSILVQSNDDKKYALEQVESGHLANWLKNYFDGTLQQHIKSEPVPEKNDEPVKVVVTHSIQEIVFDSGKNVFLEFYAPWCGHCKKLAPTLEDVAVSFQDDPEVVIAKMDATANDIKSELFEVKGFPTLYMYSASGKVISYDGDRTKEDIIDFINKNKDSASKTETHKKIETETLNDEL